jgi:AAA15 family ATPase/GTPase
MVDGLNVESELLTVSLLDEIDFNQKIRTYLGSLNLGLLDINISTKEFDATDLPSDLPENIRAELILKLKGKQSFKISAIHNTYDQAGKPTNQTLAWDFSEKESAGTQKAFKLSGPILWALANGGVIILDEIEAAMHPMMTLQTIDLFLNKEINSKNAQIVFATHDTNLLTYSKLRRDQICFTEKNHSEETEIYALSDFKYMNNEKVQKERIDSDKEKRYLEGRYGAVPVLGNFSKLFSNDG